MSKVIKVAVAWLREEDWSRWQAIDAELPPYRTWLAKVTSAMADASRQGLSPEKIMVDPDAFATWCRANGKPVHRSVRAAYAAEQLKRRLDLH